MGIEAKGPRLLRKKPDISQYEDWRLRPQAKRWAAGKQDGVEG